MRDLVIVFGVSFGIAPRARRRREVDRSDIEVVKVSQRKMGGDY